MFSFMEKWFCGIVMSLVMVAGFFVSAMQVRAGEIVGSEGVFTHAHSDACYETVTLSCESKHTSTVGVEQGIYRCENCNGGTSHHITGRTWTCPIQGVTWQTDYYIACNVCGTIHSRWSTAMPGDHHYTEQQLKCTLQENEKTATVKIVADDSWTNQGVNLITKCDILKQDLSSEGITTDWAGGSFFATVNGTYCVTATNSQGSTVLSTIQISCIDKTPPVIKSITGDESTMSDKNITVTVSVSDGESGLDAAACSLDGGASWGTYTTFKVEEGKTIQFAVRDKAGNISTATITRNQFPYPPKPVTPSAPTGFSGSSASSTLTTPLGDATQSSSTGSPTKTETNSQKKVKGQSAQQEQELQQEQQPQKTNVKLTLEEREQAYGISRIMQKKARDEFFTKSKVRQTTDQKAVAKSEATISHGDASAEANVEVDASTGTNVEVDVEANAVAKAESDAVNEDSVNFSGGIFSHLQRNGGTYFGIALCTIAAGSFVYLLWLHSAVLYCYEGGEEYRKIGFFHIKKGKNELELYLPDYILQSTKAFRYRLMLKNRLVKKCANHELVVYNEDSKLRQQVEECVDFVL